MKTWISSFLALLAVVVIAGCSQSKETTFYVAPDGNDAWNGSPEKPFATVAKARDAVRSLRQSKSALEKPVTVFIRGGMYECKEPLVFTPDDSGTEQFTITYTAAPGETPVFSGGRAITGWTEGENGVWSAELPDVKSGTWYFRQLFVNGKRCIRARIPDDGFYTVDGEITMDEQARFKYSGDDIKKEWAASGDVEIIALQAWAEFRMLVKDVDTASKTVTLSRKCRPSNREKNARYWIENVPEGLTAPGEWYLDREKGVVHYIPRDGEHMTEAEVIAPVTTSLVKFEGDPAGSRYVRNITLRGLVFAYSDWSLPDDGYADVQAAYDIPAVIAGTGAQAVTVENCSVLHHGNYGIEFAGGCTGIRIIANELADLGAGGIKIGEPVNRENPSEQTYGNLVSDNTVHDIGEIYPAACGIILFLTGKNTITHNHIYNTYYTAISNGWSWGYKETNARENIIEYNLAHDIGRGMLSDMGGNYNLGVQPGSIIRNNVFHDISSYGYGGWGIYTDEGSSDILIENNVVYRTKSGGFHQHYGRENMVRNNIFAFAREGQVIRTRMEEHLSFTFEHNIVYWSEGPLLGSNWSDDKYKLDYNVYWFTGKEPVMFKEWTLEQWQERGQDVHSVIADPLFADPEHGDFTLKPDSPVFKLGFTAIDISKVGPRK